MTIYVSVQKFWLRYALNCWVGISFLWIGEQLISSPLQVAQAALPQDDKATLKKDAQNAESTIIPAPSLNGWLAESALELSAQTSTFPTSPRNSEIYLAAPENLNPGLFVPPPPPAPPELPPVTDSERPLTFPWNWELEDLTVDFSDALTSFDQNNRFFEPTLSGTLPNGDRLSLTSGLNSFSQPDVNSVINIPLKASWTREMGDFITTVGGGVDIFNQLPLALNFAANTSVPLGDQATLSFFVEQGPYKFNATTINNQITSWRYGPNLYWQISPDTSFFSLVRWGRYNDGNREQQSFSRVEHRAGDFSLALNLFNWRYQQDFETASGYFSPPDFLVLNGEVAWEGEVFDWLDCRLVGTWGQQRLIGDWTPAFGYGSRCTAQVTESVEVDLGYSLDNVIGQSGGSSFSNQTISGQVRAAF